MIGVFRMVVARTRVDLVEMRDDIADFRELAHVDFAAADQVQHDFAQLGECVSPAAIREGVRDTLAAFAGRPLEGVAEGAHLRGGGSEKRAECAPDLGRSEASTSSLPCHARSVYRRWALTRWLWLALLASTTTACPPPEPVVPLPPVSGGKVRVRVFTEPAPVKNVGTAGRFLFVATEDALQRWDDKGAVLTMTADHGLSGDHVVALATDSERKWMWILTDGGLGHYDAGVEVYSDVAAPPAVLGIDFAAIAKEGVASLASASEGGVWLGTSKGLFFVSEKGGWVATPLKDPIHGLVRDRAGWLWIASKSGLVARNPSGDLIKIGDAQGCDVVTPRLLVEAPGDRVMVCGSFR
jgi:hypothetical protein